MIDQQDEQETILFIRRNSERRHLKTTQGHNYSQNQKPVPKWEHNTFYHEIKRKIHQKLKTEPPSQCIGLNLLKNNRLTNSKQKPKSKITISTLQMVIDPLQRRVEPAFQMERKIYHKVESNISFIKSRPTMIARNMSAKLVREPILLKNSSRSLMKKQPAHTCRKNSKIDVQPPTSISKKNSFFSLQKQKQKQSLPINQSKPLQDPNISQLLIQPNNDMGYLNRLIKSKSQMPRPSNSNKSPIKIQTFDTNPLLFYFKVKNKFKPANREMSIKKLRIKGKAGGGLV